MEATQKIDSFFRTAMKYYGKEIALPSNQHFSIDQVVDEEKDKDGEYNYMIQYGFPQSGCVSMDFGYSQESNSFSIKGISVFAPPTGENIVMANFAPQAKVGDIGISVNFGLDTGTQKHSKLSEIEENPNALKILDIAISDLDKAQVLGECREEVPVGSTRIPCCNSTRFSNEKGKHM